MTCIVGFVDKKNKKVTIGADSAGSNDSEVLIRKDPKIFKNGEFIIGCTGSFRMMQLLRFSFKPPKIGNKDIYEYMCTDFVDAVRNCFKDGGYMRRYSGGDEKGGTFIIGYKDRIFVIEDDLQVGETLNGVASVGCGSPYALGSMFTTMKSDKSAKERVTMALEAASFYSLGVAKPFLILET